MNEISLKIVIPMAGLGTRLRPHTWSKPKQLVSVAGKTVLSHVLASLATLPESYNIELVNIVGYLGDQIEEYMNVRYPELKCQYVVQENPCGQSHAIKLAEEYLDGPMLIVFADTLIETDLSFIESEKSDGVAWVKPVPDPRRFGVAVVDDGGAVTRLIEKPNDMKNNLAVVGFYYFKEAKDLISAIDTQIEKNIQLKGEYYIVDAINILLANGYKMRTENVDIWLDAGTSDALIETNRYLLENGIDNSHEWENGRDTVLVPPVYIHPSADIRHSIIGPFVSVGAECKVEESIIQNSILEDGASTKGVILEHSLIGRRAKLSRRAGRINAGDNTIVTL